MVLMVLVRLVLRVVLRVSLFWLFSMVWFCVVGIMKVVMNWCVLWFWCMIMCMFVISGLVVSFCLMWVREMCFFLSLMMWLLCLCSLKVVGRLFISIVWLVMLNYLLLGKCGEWIFSVFLVLMCIDMLGMVC